MPTTFETISALRSIHGNFTDREVSREDVETILASAIRAANASNRQSYSIVAIDDPEVILACCGYKGNKALLFCVDYNRLTALAEHTGHDYLPDGPVAFVTGAVDTILVAQTAAMTAKALGIDSLFTNGIHRKGLKATAQRFNLPEKYCFPLILLVLGYPTEEPAYLKGRVRKGVVHYNSYQRLSSVELDEMARSYDDPKNHLAVFENWVNTGMAHYLDWFFEKWIGRDVNKTQEKEFTDFLVQSGFLERERLI